MRTLAIARVGQHGSFAFLPANMVFSEQLIVFPLETNAVFAALQSRAHEVWARFFSSSMKDDLRYTPSDCFETPPSRRTGRPTGTSKPQARPTTSSAPP